LSGCTSRSGENGSGAITRTHAGDETIFWDKPFEGGKSLLLANITSKPLGLSPDCPADHPIAVLVSGTIAPHQQYGGSDVTAPICTNGRDFVEQPGTFFTIHKG
jgi:hypothetical protein